MTDDCTTAPTPATTRKLATAPANDEYCKDTNGAALDSSDDPCSCEFFFYSLSSPFTHSNVTNPKPHSPSSKCVKYQGMTPTPLTVVSMTIVTLLRRRCAVVVEEVSPDFAKIPTEQLWIRLITLANGTKTSVLPVVTMMMMILVLE